MGRNTWKTVTLAATYSTAPSATPRTTPGVEQYLRHLPTGMNVKIVGDRVWRSHWPSSRTGVQDLSGLKRSIFENSLRESAPKSF